MEILAGCSNMLQHNVTYKLCAEENKYPNALNSTHIIQSA